MVHSMGMSAMSVFWILFNHSNIMKPFRLISILFSRLLTVLNFIDDSPLLVFGRAALLGYTARGNSKVCLSAYPTCPRNPDQLVHYLNNYNGGFFRYFSGQPSPHHQNGYQNRYAGKYPFESTEQNAEERIQNRPHAVFSQVNRSLLK